MKNVNQKKIRVVKVTDLNNSNICINGQTVRLNENGIAVLCPPLTIPESLPSLVPGIHENQCDGQAYLTIYQEQGQDSFPFGIQTDPPSPNILQGIGSSDPNGEIMLELEPVPDQVNTNAGGALIIGQIDMDPRPKYDIHFATYFHNNLLGLHPQKAHVWVEDGINYTLNLTYDLSLTSINCDLQDVIVNVKTRQMPVIQDDQERNSPSFMPLVMGVALDNGNSERFYFYLKRIQAEVSDPCTSLLELYYYKTVPLGNVVKVGNPILESLLRFTAIRVAFKQDENGNPVPEFWDTQAYRPEIQCTSAESDSSSDQITMLEEV